MSALTPERKLQLWDAWHTVGLTTNEVRELWDALEIALARAEQWRQMADRAVPWKILEDAELWLADYDALAAEQERKGREQTSSTTTHRPRNGANREHGRTLPC